MVASLSFENIASLTTDTEASERETKMERGMVHSAGRTGKVPNLKPPTQCPVAFLDFVRLREGKGVRK
jgi:hypothetical protein